jgi:hypothetical protein
MFSLSEFLMIISHFLKNHPDVLSPSMYCTILKKIFGHEDEIKIELFELIRERALTFEQIKSLNPLKEIIYLCGELPSLMDIDINQNHTNSTNKGLESLYLCIYLYIHQILSRYDYNVQEYKEQIMKDIESSLLGPDYMLENTQENIKCVFITINERCRYIMEYIEDLRELESCLKWV